MNRCIVKMGAELPEATVFHSANSLVLFQCIKVEKDQASSNDNGYKMCATVKNWNYNTCYILKVKKSKWIINDVCNQQTVKVAQRLTGDFVVEDGDRRFYWRKYSKCFYLEFKGERVVKAKLFDIVDNRYEIFDIGIGEQDFWIAWISLLVVLSIEFESLMSSKALIFSQLTNLAGKVWF
jgi:hypothetical protein